MIRQAVPRTVHLVLYVYIYIYISFVGAMTGPKPPSPRYPYFEGPAAVRAMRVCAGPIVASSNAGHLVLS